MNTEKTSWMYPEQVYIVSRGASANSLFFEDRECHQIFFDYLQRFVGPMVNILHYKLNEYGWAILVQTKSKDEICNAYYRQRDRSVKADREKDLHEPKRMISEHFRMFLSNFAKQCNYHLKRKGVYVMKKFDKVRITNKGHYEKEFEKICDFQSSNYQQVIEKYRPNIDLYDIEGLMSDSEQGVNTLRSSNVLYSRDLEVDKMPIQMVKVRPNSYLLRKILKKGKNYPNQENPTPKNE